MASDEKGTQADRSVLFAAVPVELHTAARVRAVQERRPVARLIEEAVTKYLEAPEPTTA